MSKDTLRDAREPGFFMVDNELIDNYGPKIGAYGVAVYNVLARYANRHGENAFPSYKHIAEKLNVSRDTAIRAIKTLVDYGLVEKHERRDAAGDPTSNEYVLVHIKCSSSQQLPSSSQQLPSSSQQLPSSSQLLPLVAHSNYGSRSQQPYKDLLINTNLDQDTQAQSAATQPVLDIPIDPEPVPVKSAVDQFRDLHEQLKETKNRNAVLMDIYKLCFGDADLPAFGRLGVVAKQVGGAGRLADLMWQLTSRPPTGNALDYIVKAHTSKVQNKKIDQSEIRVSRGKAFMRDYTGSEA